MTKTATAKAGSIDKPGANLPAETGSRHPLSVLKSQIEQRETEFALALPQHIPPARFVRVIQTAVSNNLDLLKCDRASFFNAALRAAQDGLLPDGREGAIVSFNSKGRTLAQWLPMYQGLLKKVRNSGEFKWMTAQVVYEGDRFRHWIDETGEHFEHNPEGISATPVKVYAAVTTQSGGAFVEVMTVAQVRKVQAASRAKSEYGPWAQWWDEMAKKTAFRRLAKRLPLSSDLDDLVRRDDALYDFGEDREDAKASNSRRITNVSAAFDQFAHPGPTIDHDPDTGEIDGRDAGPADDFAEDDPPPRGHQEPRRDARQAQAGNTRAQQKADPEPRKPQEHPPQDDRRDDENGASDDDAAGDDGGDDAGDDDGNDGGEAGDRFPPGMTPTTEAEYASYVKTKLSDWTNKTEFDTGTAQIMGADGIASWWKGKAERDLRNACGVTEPVFNDLLALCRARVDAIRKGK